ncbi:hypothetical protein OH76DRAFT_1366849 [Lentinus brumalis]|uniref:MULE transposase domain-containing protein n=1 Tax=Lentinus brumalis TaxID=2498619 RepID=A0A371CI90_9APHY|nr:hypothetical protein OH76DRAFT_1366849 [Polyporus brumalis]
METFDCHGWLFITVSETSDTATVKLSHRLAHVYYYPIDLPNDVVDLIQNNPNMTVNQLWTDILKQHPEPLFERKSVYAKWAQQDRLRWKRDDDELKSARILLDEAKAGGSHAELYTVEAVDLPEVEGFTALAFALPNILRKWGGRIREIALDSAWNTNGSGFELYALLGEVYGSGIPLGYLLLRSSAGVKGGKEQFLTHFLGAIRDKWNIQAHFTLTDKDWSEINACRASYPDAKHQLCYWHCLRAIKTRLSILRRTPAFYNSTEAHAEFSWIDEAFVPVQQRDNPVRHCQYSASPL